MKVENDYLLNNSDDTNAYSDIGNQNNLKNESDNNVNPTNKIHQMYVSEFQLKQDSDHV